MEDIKSSERRTQSPVQQKKPVIAISTGDPNGVGYEIIIKTLANPHILEVCTPVIFGNQHVLKEWQKTLDEELHGWHTNLISNIDEAQTDKVNIINVYPDTLSLRFGESTKEGGEASFLSLSKACDALESGKAQALVTAPINKENIQSDKFRFTGHTEYITSRFGAGKESLMMMASEQMRIALVCNHIPLQKVAECVTEENILKKLRILNTSLVNDFLIRYPRIAVLALNPHAGDKGLLGEEEQTIISPAVKKAAEEGINAFGPYTADGFFGSGKYRHFDAILAMYHDQGLIPFKSLDMSGVNYTAGLNVIRTSPDHGTAYDLAGKNEASPLSFEHALYMALDLLKNRAITAEITLNPLPVKERIPERREPREFKGFNPAEARREREERQAAELTAARQAVNTRQTDVNQENQIDADDE